MPRARTARSSVHNRVFLISGVPESERILLGKNIQKLGGIYVKSDNFKSNATHVVCGRLTRSEKFLGAVTLGKWVVRPEYVQDSHKAGRWLNEVSYEWSITGPVRDQVLAAAAKRARWRVSTTTEKIFQDWQVAVVLSDANRQTVYKRLLSNGGARVYDIKLPVTQGSAVVDSLTYLFTDAKLAPNLMHLQEWGILCVNADFISDFLILDPPPDAMDYALSPPPAAEALTQDSADACGACSSSAVPSGPSGSGSSFLCLSQEEDESDTLMLSQCGGEGNQAEEEIQCPVIISPRRLKEGFSAKTAAASTSSHQRPSNPRGRGRVASATAAVKSHPEDHGKQIIPADIKGEMKELKEEVCGASVKLKGSMTTAKTSQRSLREWFTPEGKENGRGRGLVPLKKEPHEEQKMKRQPSLCEEKRPLSITTRHEQERKTSDRSRSPIHRRARRTQDAKSDSVRAKPHIKQMDVRESAKPPVALKRNREEKRRDKPACKKQKISESSKVHVSSTSISSELFEVSAQERNCTDIPDTSPDGVIIVESQSEDSDLPDLSPDCVIISDSQSEESDASQKQNGAERLKTKKVERTNTKQTGDISDCVVVTDSQSDDANSEIKVPMEREKRTALLQKEAVRPNLQNRLQVKQTQKPANSLQTSGSLQVEQIGLPTDSLQERLQMKGMEKSTDSDSLQNRLQIQAKERENPTESDTLQARQIEKPINSDASKNKGQANQMEKPTDSDASKSKGQANQMEKPTDSDASKSKGQANQMEKPTDSDASKSKGQANQMEKPTDSDASKSKSRANQMERPTDSDASKSKGQANQMEKPTDSDALQARLMENPTDSESLQNRFQTGETEKPTDSLQYSRQVSEVHTEVTDTERRGTVVQCSAHKSSSPLRPASYRKRRLRSSVQTDEMKQITTVLHKNNQKKLKSPLKPKTGATKCERAIRSSRVLHKTVTNSRKLKTAAVTESAIEGGDAVGDTKCPSSRSPDTVKRKPERQRTVRGVLARHKEEQAVPLPGGDSAVQETTHVTETMQPDPSRTAKEPQAEAGSSDKVFSIFSQVKTAAEAKKKAQQKEKDSQSHCTRPVRRKGPFVQPRWQLSTVPVPGGWVLDSPSGTLSHDLGSHVIPDAMNMVVGTCIDEHYYEAGVTTAASLNFACPSAEMVGHMVTVLQEADEERILNQAYSTLTKWLDLFPPVSKDHRNVYESALKLSDWEFVREIFEKAIGSQEEEKGPGACLLLKFLRAVLERNFLSFLHNVSKQASHTCLVIRCLWSPSYQVYPNARTRQLLQYLESSIKAGNSPLACWDNVLGVVAMAAQCCQLVGCGWRWDATGQVDHTCIAFVRDIASTIAAGYAESSVLSVAHMVAQVSPPWLQREICCHLLAEYDDYLVPGGLTTEPTTLMKIVSQYFFLLPHLSEQVSADSESKSPRKKHKESVPETAEEQEVAHVKSKLTADKINKKNFRGETMLHKAAMKNDVSRLKQLLAVPGTDVNAKDNAGWTPLHEACNHGNIECAKALLKFNPGKTIDTFFQPGSQRARRVDIHAANAEGITPLHDAVMCGRMDVVKLLLKYGGSSLLDARTAQGKTPLDLATTEGMKQVLSSDLDRSQSQDSFSQEFSTKDQPVPTSFMYNEVVSNGNLLLAASLDDCAKFLALLTCLLRSQLKTQQQQQRQLPQQQQQPQQQKDGEQQENERRALQPEQLKTAAGNLRRHVKKLTTEETFRNLEFRLMLVEALLCECALQ